MTARMEDVLARASQALAELRAVDLDGVVDDRLTEAVLACQELRGALDAAEAKVLARWDGRGVWRPSGAKSGAAWLAWRQHLPIGIARQRVRHARATRSLPAIEEAWAAGEIDRSHVTTLLAARTPRTAEVFDADGHTALLEVARTSWFTNFKRVCDRWQMVVDPDGAEQGADADRAARSVCLAESFRGMWSGRILLDAVSGTVVANTLVPIERELFEADWAEATQRLGRKPLAHELRRTPAQRRADALVEMAIRARTAPADGRRPAPLFTVVVGLKTLTGPVLELFNRRQLTPGTVAPMLTEADVERIVFGSPSRVLDVGAQRRFFRGALRRAIEVRDRTCFHPTCDDPPERPEIDHVHEAAKGGATTQENGQLACRFHNARRNQPPDGEDEDDDAALRM